MTGHCIKPIEVDHGGWLRALTFSADSARIFSAGQDGIRAWRVADGQEIATMEASGVWCLAVSSDGKWLAAGTYHGDVFVWDSETCERIFEHSEDDSVFGVDFSPDSARLISGSRNGTATIFDLATRKEVQTLRHNRGVIATKYAPQGDRLATATKDFVWVWDSKNGRPLVDIKVALSSRLNKGLLWLHNYLLVVSDEKVKQIEASTGLIVFEWPIHKSGIYSSISRPSHGEFIAYSTQDTVTFWDTETRTQFGLVSHAQGIQSVVFSQCDRLIATGGENGKIRLYRLSDFITLVRLHHGLQELDIQIDDDVLDCWMNNKLEDADALLTAVISAHKPTHHLLANRALVRARLGKWGDAIADVTESLEIQPSAIGYIAKSAALVRKGERCKAYQACDIALWRFHSEDDPFPLLIKATIIFMAGEHDDAISRVDELIDGTPLGSTCDAVQAYMLMFLGNLHLESGNYNGAIRLLERARGRTRPLTDIFSVLISLISGWMFDDLEFIIGQHLCEALYAAGRTKEAGESLLAMTTSVEGDIGLTRSIITWISDFTQRCLSLPESCGKTSSSPLFKEWVKSTLTRSSWKDTLNSALNFTVPRFTIFQAICDHLEMANHETQAIECFHYMNSEFMDEANMDGDQMKWVVDFKSCCGRKLEDLGDVAANAGEHHDAILRYSAALSLNPTSPQGLLVKRSKACVEMKMWKDALNDADTVIALDSSSPWGYERKHRSLHGAGCHSDAIYAFETMLLKISLSHKLEVREHYRDYVHPDQTKAAIRDAIQNTIREFPLVLINTHSGLLLDKLGQAQSFESEPIFLELISSMVTHIDHARIQREVAEYYRYAAFSHTWELNEPLFERVVRIVVYELEESPAHDKLQMFCKIVRDSGFRWAWSDNCCINKADHVELQEALISMFRWYEGSTLTIVFLRGVRSPPKRGDLARSIWNTRGWTFQEYHASKVVRFYTQDWKPYLDSDIWNHKESPEIISEMEEATGVSAQALMALRPGLDDVREKLRLASTRKTTRVEDEAYSLLGIFSMSLPVVYGEGDKALGRFLAQLLTSSGDARILAWTGRSGSFNSCLPSNIVPFSQLPTTHVPQALESDETVSIVARLRSSSLSSTSLVKLHERLYELPTPIFVGQRMKLPCIVLKLGRPSLSRSGSGHVFRAETPVGAVEITCEENLSCFDSLYLIHPWIDALLGRHPVQNMVEPTHDKATDDPSSTIVGAPFRCPDPAVIVPAMPHARAAQFVARLGRQVMGRRRTTPTPIPRDAASLRPSSLSPSERYTRALEVLVRLSRPFGALLLTPGSGAAYRRVAAESLVVAQVEIAPPAGLDKLIGCVRTVDVL